MDEPVYREWQHSPSHLFVPNASYIVTGATYRKEHLFDTPAKLTGLLNLLFEEADRKGWRLEAWAVMSNHYHFVGVAPGDVDGVALFIKALHSRAAIWLNKCDDTPGRKVLYQFWDTCLTDERSHFARLHYVHNNPVKHGLVENAANYPWCSMNWFCQNASAGFKRTVLSFKIDRVVVKDDF